MAHIPSKTPISLPPIFGKIILAGSAIAMGFACRAEAQMRSVPYFESFESTIPPALPPGWRSSQNKSAGNNDFVTSAGTSYSGANAALGTNATIGQELVTQELDFSGRIPDRLSFYVRRSSSFRALVVVEAFADSGDTFTMLIGDTLRPTSSSGYVHSSFALPPTLAGVPGVRVRWRIIPDATGATGTIRLDDISVTARAACDLALSRIQCFPPSPTVDDPITASVVLRNIGEPTDHPVLVHICRDANGDSIGQRIEVIASMLSSAPIPAYDSVEIQIPLGRIVPGTILLIGVLDDSLDQDHSNDTCRFPLVVGFRRGSLVVNEIMYAPASPEPEWVECVNAGRDSVNLQNWLISDAAFTVRHPVTRLSIIVPPGGYVLLTRDSAAMADVHPLLCASIVSVPGFPSLNNGGDAVVLYDLAGRCMDSVVYVPAWGGAAGGRSLERIDVGTNPLTASNWGTSRDTCGSTPGLPNSIARKDNDLALDSLSFVPANPGCGDIITISACVRNIGRQPVVPGSIEFSFDANDDSLAEAGEEFGTCAISMPVPSLDSLVGFCSYRPERSGVHRFFATMHPLDDQDSSNNSTAGVVIVDPPAGAVRINEVMYDPPPGYPEWVELVNVTHETIDLRGWRIGNHSPSSRYRIVGGEATLPPFGFIVIARDTTTVRQAFCAVGRLIQVAGLSTYYWSNGGDAVVLLDPRGITVDSVWYRASWGGNGGSSLERADPGASSLDSTNWRGSVDSCRSTPGRRNSTAILPQDVSIGGIRGNWVGEDAVALVSVLVVNTGKAAVGPFGVALFEDVDLDSLAEPEERMTHIDILQGLQVRDSLMAVLRWSSPGPGIHHMIVEVEFPEDGRPADNRARCTITVPFAPRSIIINEIMYDPRAGGAEYVELMNVSGHDVDMAGWSITDRPSPGGGYGHIRLSSGSRRFRNSELFTAASDSSILSFFPETQTIGARLLNIGGWTGFGLNNGGDDVVLRDPTGNVIDSVAYLPAWHRSSITDCAGRSLEKIQPTLPSIDARNWSTSTNPRGGTPCGRNSIRVDGPSGGPALSFSPNPFSPDGDGVEDFVLIRFELPVNVAQVDIKIFDVKGRLVRHLANNEPSGGRGAVLWDGCDDERRQVRIGIYIVLLEASNDRGGTAYTTRGALVVAAKL
jgi:hypothetical protein